MKPGEKGIIDPIADAFAMLERQDIRVNKVMLTLRKYHELIHLDRMQHNYFVDLNDYLAPDNGASIWGAKIKIGHKNAVFSEERYELQSEPIEFTAHYIRGNLTIIVKSRARPLYNVQPNEWTAIETLREMITETEFRKFLAHGFILVPGKSGKVYQIFRHRQHTNVWKGGKLIEEICVVIPDPMIPATDKLIVLKTMIESDEEEFRRCGNVYNMRKAA